MASVAIDSAVSKPKVMSVMATSLSMVLGRVRTFIPGLGQPEGVFLGAAAADADQCLKVVAIIIVDHHLGHVLDLGAHRHFVRLVAAGAEDGSAQGEDARQHFPLKQNRPVFHEAAKTVAETDHLHIIGAGGTLADGPNGRIQSGLSPPAVSTPIHFPISSPLMKRFRAASVRRSALPVVNHIETNGARILTEI
jgi:hypothetical protein